MKLHLPKKLPTAVIIALAAALPATYGADVISISFGGTQMSSVTDTNSTLGGIDKDGNWNIIPANDTAGTPVVNQSNQAAGILKMENIAGGWSSSVGDTSTVTGVVQRNYVDIKNHSGGNVHTISLAHDYWIADVTYYLSGDAGGTWAPMEINGTQYIGGTNNTLDEGENAAWGTRGGVTAYDDSNSITVTGLTGSTIVGKNIVIANNLGARATLGGMQVVDSSATRGYTATLGAGTTNAADASWTNSGTSVAYNSIPAGEKYLGVTASAEGSTLMVAGGESLKSVAALGNDVTLAADGNITVSSLYAAEGASLTVTAGLNSSNMSIYGKGSISLNGSLEVNGNTLTATAASISVPGKLYSKNGTINLGDGINSGTFTVDRVEVGDLGSGTSAINIESGYTLKVTGSRNDIGQAPGLYKTNSFILSEWENVTTMTVKGTVLAENAAVMTGDREAVINIANGGTLATKGLARCHVGKDKTSTLNLSEGGKLILGDMGMDYDGYVNANISGGTIGIAADNATISDALNITGNLTIDTTRYSYGENGLTQGTTGGTLKLAGNLTGTGSLTATGTGTLGLGSIESSVAISTGTADVNFFGSLSLGEDVTFSAGSGAFTVELSEGSDFLMSGGNTIADKDGNEATNGFIKGSDIILIQGGIIEEAFEVTYNGSTYTIDNDNRNIVSANSIDLSTWYITEGSSTLSEVYAQSASASISAAAGTTLNVDTALAEGTGIELTGDAQLNIAANQSISAGKVTTNGHTVGLDGSGTYTINSGNATAVSIADTWTGLVELFGQTNASLDLTAYGRSGSTISIKEYTGYFANNQSSTKNIDANLVLTNTSLAAVELTNGYSGCTYNFNGSISGGGNFIINKNLNGGKMTLNFAGDTSNWTGTMEVIAGEHNVKFTNTTTINNNTIRTRKEAGATMNLTIEHASAAVTVNSSIAQEAGAMKLTANAAQGVTFKQAVTTTSTTLGAGTAATFEANANLGDLTLGAGATVTATGSLTLGSLTLDLASYTTDYTAHTLVSTTGELTFTGDLSSYQNVLVGDYIATISNTNNSLLLTFTARPEEDPAFAVLSQAGYADGMLTLTVNADLLGYDFTENGAIIIPGIDGDIMKDILSLTNLPEDGMVGITLQGIDGETLSASADGQIGFLGKDGVSVYYGENVGGAWQYQVNFIPEPTTATLSLLALAGLAARRRRK